MRVKLEGDFVVFLIGMRINKFWHQGCDLNAANAKRIGFSSNSVEGIIYSSIIFGLIIDMLFSFFVEKIHYGVPAERTRHCRI